MKTELCKLSEKYGTDKGTIHSYTPFYYELLKDKKDSIKKVLEVGIGDAGYRNRLSKDVPNVQLGASLKMWRDFFPNAQIYGADIDPQTMFEDERIKTFVCDETSKEQLEGLIRKVGDIDLFIDDGSHKVEHQVFMAQTVLPLLKKDVIYIIEDVYSPGYVFDSLKDYRCIQPKIDEIPHNHKLKNRLIIVSK